MREVQRGWKGRNEEERMKGKRKEENMGEEKRRYRGETEGSSLGWTCLPCTIKVKSNIAAQV